MISFCCCEGDGILAPQIKSVHGLHYWYGVSVDARTGPVSVPGIASSIFNRPETWSRRGRKWLSAKESAIITAGPVTAERERTLGVNKFTGEFSVNITESPYFFYTIISLESATIQREYDSGDTWEQIRTTGTGDVSVYDGPDGALGGATLIESHTDVAIAYTLRNELSQEYTIQDVKDDTVALLAQVELSDLQYADELLGDDYAAGFRINAIARYNPTTGSPEVFQWGQSGYSAALLYALDQKDWALRGVPVASFNIGFGGLPGPSIIGGVCVDTHSVDDAEELANPPVNGKSDRFYSRSPSTDGPLFGVDNPFGFGSFQPHQGSHRIGRFPPGPRTANFIWAAKSAMKFPKASYYASPATTRMRYRRVVGSSWALPNNVISCGEHPEEWRNTETIIQPELDPESGEWRSIFTTISETAC